MINKTLILLTVFLDFPNQQMHPLQCQYLLRSRRFFLQDKTLNLLELRIITYRHEALLLPMSAVAILSALKACVISFKHTFLTNWYMFSVVLHKDSHVCDGNDDCLTWMSVPMNATQLEVVLWRLMSPFKAIPEKGDVNKFNWMYWEIWPRTTTPH